MELFDYINNKIQKIENKNNKYINKFINENNKNNLENSKEINNNNYINFRHNINEEFYLILNNHFDINTKSINIEDIQGDGNCLYRSFSKFLYGIEELHEK